jgi:hypothetical protein
MGAEKPSEKKREGSREGIAGLQRKQQRVMLAC